ncbi:hypothetical protein CGZ92_02570 [Parenemella sanctibonifatiensis]|uniref:DUF3043 domain-containing protein n=1 Tax=Parenemella sanctibonifatiensis TaxID=2016505 RepID=A0A255EFA7_9ACTN|nr:hypothetical protein CGZ92_02570 [Parenemella sanctibonifatiensis]
MPGVHTVGLFKPYERQSADAKEGRTSLVRTNEPSTKNAKVVTAPAPEPKPEQVPGAKKPHPTRSRKEAERERREALHPTLSKAERRKRERQAKFENRDKALQLTEKMPSRELMRNHIDSRRNLAEFALPVMIVILAVLLLGSQFPVLQVIASLATWLLLVLVVLDMWVMWRGYKKLLNERLPNEHTRGLFMYGLNRAMQIRRFRQPAPTIKRGEKF